MFALLAVLAALHPLHLTAKDNNKVFTVKPTTPVVLTLLSDPGVRRHWKLLTTPNPKAVVLVSHRKVWTGAAVNEVWRFRAVGAWSRARIRLEWVAPGSHSDDRFWVRIRVR